MQLGDKGDRVEFVSSNDPYTDLTEGDQGEIFLVDHLGTRHIKWDSGSSLGLIPELDRWRVLSTARSQEEVHALI